MQRSQTEPNRGPDPTADNDQIRKGADNSQQPCLSSSTMKSAPMTAAERERIRAMLWVDAAIGDLRD